MRLTITAKLLLASVGLLALPWLGLATIGEMRELLLGGQVQAQVLAARTLAAVLARDGVLDGTPGGRQSLYLYPLPGHLEIDGYAGDWPDVAGATPAGDGREPGYSLTLGERRGRLFALVTVRDEQLSYRQPGAGGGAFGDRLRIRLRDRRGRVSERVIAPDGPGELPLLQEGRWSTAAWQALPGGYRVELELFPADAVALALAVDDRDAGDGPVVTTGFAAPRPLLRRLPAVQSLLTALGDATAAAWVLDADGWVRAAATGEAEPVRSRLDDALVRAALAGRGGTQRVPIPYSGGETLRVAEPVVREASGVQGVVLLEQDSARVLDLQLAAFESVALASLGALALVLGALVLFAWRLTWRIRQLGRETGAAIDGDGRVRARALVREARTADELGELSRRISAMLGRLARYTGFLERMPRTLRHEINNPLNVIATSLHNYTERHPGAAGDPYLESAGRALRRLGHIVQGMTEAASLEDDLRREARHPLDLAALAAGYADSVAALHPDRVIAFDGPRAGVRVEGNDLRLEQLLDKLLDNALDFTPPGGEIRFVVAQPASGVCLRVENAGPAIAPELSDTLFDSMVSRRPQRRGERPHLGIGLYLARLIAEFHGGRITAGSRADGGGARFEVWIPRGG